MSYKALFIHIPKTGGSSISTAPFILKYGSFGIPADTEFLTSMTRFTFIRNPYERFISASLNLDYTTKEKLEQFTEELTLEKILEDDYFIHIRPMWWYIQDSVDYIGRFETLQDDWQTLCELVGEVHPLPHHNKSETSGTDYMKFYTPKMKEIVEEIYARDFTEYDYGGY